MNGSIFFSSIIISIAWLTTVVALPYVKKLGLKFQIFDNPSSRKQHTEPKVRIGGLAMIVGLFCSWILLALIADISNLNSLNGHFILLIISGSLTFFLIGFADDLFKISPFPRLLLQIIAALFVSSQGLTIKSINLGWISPEWTMIALPTALGTLITVLWFTGITNSINWLDGLDGLASGVAVIAFGFFHYLSSSSIHSEFTFLVSALIGTSLGFLTQNAYPARILMGDSGSYLIGFNFASLSILGFTSNISFPISSYSSFDIIVPLLIIFVPTFDMLMVIITRIRNGRSPFYPDRSHLHHRILNLGLSHPQTVLSIYSLTLFSGLLAFMISKKEIEFNLIAICFFTFFLITTIIIRRRIR